MPYATQEDIGRNCGRLAEELRNLTTIEVCNRMVEDFWPRKECLVVYWDMHVRYYHRDPQGSHTELAESGEYNVTPEELAVILLRKFPWLLMENL